MGTWRAAEPDTPDDPDAPDGPDAGPRYAFRDDGTVQVRDADGDLFVGAFEIADGLLVIEAAGDDGDELALTATYHVSATRLVLGGAVPDGRVSGLIGTWRAIRDESRYDAVTMRQESVRLETELAFGADGTVMMTVQSGDQIRSGTGTYERRDDSVRISIGRSTQDLRLIDGGVIGGAVMVAR